MRDNETVLFRCLVMFDFIFKLINFRVGLGNVITVGLHQLTPSIRHACECKKIGSGILSETFFFFFFFTDRPTERKQVKWHFLSQSATGLDSKYFRATFSWQNSDVKKKKKKKKNTTIGLFRSRKL